MTLNTAIGEGDSRRDKIREEIRSYFVEQGYINREAPLTEDMRFGTKPLDLESLEYLELLIQFEELPSDPTGLRTVGDVISYIIEKRDSQQ